MKKQEKTYLQSSKYRCPLCKQYVAASDYLFTNRRSAKGEWVMVERCRKCKELGL